MSSVDQMLTDALAREYCRTLAVFENTESPVALAGARWHLRRVVETSAALLEVISEDSRRLNAAERSGAVANLAKLAAVDVDSLVVDLPNTETLEHRGCAADD
jgi:hypothetical protein